MSWVCYSQYVLENTHYALLPEKNPDVQPPFVLFPISSFLLELLVCLSLKLKNWIWEESKVHGVCSLKNTFLMWIYCYILRFISTEQRYYEFSFIDCHMRPGLGKRKHLRDVLLCQLATIQNILIACNLTVVVQSEVLMDARLLKMNQSLLNELFYSTSGGRDHLNIS